MIAVNNDTWMLILLLALLIVASLLLDFMLGPSGLPLQSLWQTLTDPASADPGTRAIVWDIRLPYAVMAIIVGLALGLAGAEMQTILNNPLASPFTLGVSSAAAFGAALAIVLGIGLPGIPGQWFISANAFIFALLAALLTWWLAGDKQAAAGTSAVGMPAAGISAAGLPAAGERSALDVIATRTSVRAYRDCPVGADTVELLLRAAMAAPSAMNRQPWVFVVVDDKALLQKFADSLQYAKMAVSAPLAVVVCADLTRNPGASGDWWVMDASAASENLLLAAHAVGLGAVWTGVYPRSERVKAVRTILGLPESVVPLNVIPIGYPAETPEPKQKWNPGNIRRNGWTR